jgi:hypothetical protein
MMLWENINASSENHKKFLKARLVSTVSATEYCRGRYTKAQDSKLSVLSPQFVPSNEELV